MKLREDCDYIVRQALAQVQPDQAVRRALENRSFDTGRLVLVAAGKAAWSMAQSAWGSLGRKPDRSEEHTAEPPVTQ